MSEHAEKLFKLAYRFYLAPNDLLYQVRHYKVVGNEFMVLLELLDEDSGHHDSLLHYADAINISPDILRAALKKFLAYYLLIDSHDHYQTLGVKPDAEAGEIRKHYRYLIGIFHPDKNASDTGSYALLINQAYNTLKKSSSRKSYDKKQAKDRGADYGKQNQPAHGQRYPLNNRTNRDGVIAEFLGMLPGFRNNPRAWVWSSVVIIIALIALNPFAGYDVELARDYISEETLNDQSSAAKGTRGVDITEDGIGKQDAVTQDDQIASLLKQELSRIHSGTHQDEMNADGDPAVVKQIAAPVAVIPDSNKKTAISASAISAEETGMTAEAISTDDNLTNPMAAANVSNTDPLTIEPSAGIDEKEPGVKVTAEVLQLVRPDPVELATPVKTGDGEEKISVALPGGILPIVNFIGSPGSEPGNIPDQRLYDILSSTDQAAVVFNAGTPEMVLMKYVSAYESGNAKVIANMFSSADEGRGGRLLEEHYNQLFNRTRERKLTINELIVKSENNSEALLLSDVVLSLRHKQNNGFKQYSGKVMFRIIGNKDGMLISGLIHNVR